MTAKKVESMDTMDTKDGGERDGEKKAAEAFARLYKIIKALRAEDGCPWDREQTPLSMRADLIEETFEAVDAIEQGEGAHVKEELGDVFLNSTMISYMFEQRGDFSVADALDGVSDKLVRRHPHVFARESSDGARDVKTGAQVLAQWDSIKENVEGRKSESVLDEVPKGFPPFFRSYKMQKKAAKKGWVWKSCAEALAKAREEADEVEDALARREKSGSAEDSAHLEEECGDLVFAAISCMIKLGVHPEIALRKANEKFYRRFSFVERRMKESGIPLDADHVDCEMRFWREAKAAEQRRAD